MASHISSATGRVVWITVSTVPRSPVIQVATSSTLLTVALSPISRMCRGDSMITSSHTVPRG